MANKPIICIDFDGVIHSYTSGWKGVDVIPDPPVPGAFVAMTVYLQHFRVAVFSSRSKSESGIWAMRNWFLKYDWPDSDRYGYPNGLEFPTDKPPALVTIDDRGITFTGSWPTVDEIKNFRPWYLKK